MSTYSQPRTYDHRSLEAKWSARFQKDNVFSTPHVPASDAKRYILDMFPYPSGAGLHVGHLLAYTGSDVLARVATKQGCDVLHPMGWDAFGLPAENYAIKTGVSPFESTETNIAHFKEQLLGAGFSYDWSKEINTSSPEYYKWTQWLFGILYKRGLAYKKDGAVNWCPKDLTVLANEQVINGACERCGTQVVQKEMKQWYFKITDYAEELLNDLDNLEWPEKIKAMQRNWIGKSSGASVVFIGELENIEVFTTRPDTIHGVTFLAIAPEHPLLVNLTSSSQKAAVEEYVSRVSKVSERERTFTDREKTGVFTGGYVTNQATGQYIPVWVADYVLAKYATGAVMGVPAHDARDFEFATKYELPIKQAIGPIGALLPYLAPAEPAEVEKGIADSYGVKKITYRLRDWLVSRQRYWGVPIPILYNDQGQEKVVSEAQLPVILPKGVDFMPTGLSPLEAAVSWKKVIEPDGSIWQRETDTLDTFVCSSWYYLRYPTPHLQTAAFSKEALDQWLPVDTYLGGAEHAVLHLLYARFITKVLADEGLLTFREPFTRLINQGMILGSDHQKMSKSKGNIVNPDEVIDEVGADTLRMYELFLAPFDAEKPWDTKGITGVRRFLDRVWRLSEKVTDEPTNSKERAVLRKLITAVTTHISGHRFNVTIAQFMEAMNALDALHTINADTYKTFLGLLNPFAPFVTEELWEIVGFDGLCMHSEWPTASVEEKIEHVVTVIIQVNGKVRGKLEVTPDLSEQELVNLAQLIPSVANALAGKKIVKQVVIANKVLSLVAE